jgi:hypothetical protein
MRRPCFENLFAFSVLPCTEKFVPAMCQHAAEMHRIVLVEIPPDHPFAGVDGRAACCVDHANLAPSR